MRAIGAGRQEGQAGVSLDAGRGYLALLRVQRGEREGQLRVRGVQRRAQRRARHRVSAVAGKIKKYMLFCEDE